MSLRKPIAVRLVFHVLLLAGAGVFALPFAWMLATSMMVDKEAFSETGIQLLPDRPVPRAVSPYIDEDEWDGMVQPEDVADDVWQEWEPRLRTLMLELAKTIKLHPPAGVDEETAWNEAIEGCWDELRRRVPTRAFREADFEVVRALIESDLTGDLVTKRLYRARRTFTVSHVQFTRADDLRQFRLTQDMTIEELGTFWRVEQGTAELHPQQQSGSAFVEVHYDLSDGRPLVLVADCDVPEDTPPLPDGMKGLSLAFRHDESWNRMSLEIELGGVKYASDQERYFALDRDATFVVQLPGPQDDDPTRVKNYVGLHEVGRNPAFDHGARKLRLRAIVHPSSHASAWYGKATRNYRLATQDIPFWRFTATSIVLVLMNVGLTMLSSSLVAYAFARLHWPGRDFCFILLLGTMMIPPQVTMIPGFVIVKALGWYNTLTPLWAFAAFGTAFHIFLLRQFLKGIPQDLEDAARIDGCGFLRVYWHVMLPLVKPTLAAIGIFTFIGTWNDFMGPLIYVNDPRLYPLALGLFSLHALNPPQPMTVLMAGSVLMTLPIIAIFFFAQKYFIQGVTLTGMKG